MKNKNLVSLFPRATLFVSVLALTTCLQAESQPLPVETPPLALENSQVDQGWLPNTGSIAAEDFFEAADLDKNGKLSLEEYLGLIEARRMIAVEEQFIKLDADEDGVLSREELYSESKNPSEVDNLFSKVSHLSGEPEFVNLDEFEILLMMQAAAKKIADDFAKKDQDQDNLLSVNELDEESKAPSNNLQQKKEQLEKAKSNLAKLQTKLSEAKSERRVMRLKERMDKVENWISTLEQQIGQLENPQDGSSDGDSTDGDSTDGDSSDENGTVTALRTLQRNEELFQRMVPPQAAYYEYTYSNDCIRSRPM